MHFRLSFSHKLFLSVVVLFWFFAGCFIFYQYMRECDYKVELLNDRLAITNTHIATMIEPGCDYDSIVRHLVRTSHFDDLRVTLMDARGDILYDNAGSEETMQNHIDRKEVRDALKKGFGYSIMRNSDTMGSPYFYYASYFKENNLIVRSALPYNVSLINRLKADMSYFWIMMLLTLGLTVVFYDQTRRLGKTITQLRRFAKKADMDEPFELKLQPTGDNELDMIARHIVDIYYRLRKTKDELYVAREKLIAHLQMSNEGLAIFSPAKELILSNALFMQYVNLISDKSVSSTDEVFHLPELQRLVNFIIETGRDFAVAESKQMNEIIDKNGYIFLLDAVVFQDASFELSISDITQQEEQARMKRQITQNMAHELKTPVSSIQGYLETIINNPDMGQDTQKQFLQRCYAQSNRLANLLRDITALTRLDEASGMIEIESVDLRKIIDNITAEVALALEEKEMTLVCSLPQTMPMQGNPSLLYSIFRNLTDNAIAYAGIGCRIKINCFFDDEDYYYFSFKDNGVGVQPQHLGRLFERFYRVDKGRSRKIGGTGLGLAIVKNAIIFHGGTIHAKQANGGGLEFVFVLQKHRQQHSAVELKHVD